MTAAPLSRQPECRYCQHEDHILRCEMPLDGGAMCPCPPHAALGVYT